MITRRKILGYSAGLGASAFAQSIPSFANTEPSEGGIGGTGVYFGPVVRQAGLTINGETLDLPPTVRARIAITGQPVLTLATGDTVFATATNRADGAEIELIVRFLPLVGSIDGIGGTGGPLRVMGTRIRMTGSTIVEDAAGSQLSRSLLRPDLSVAVSGVWRNQAVVATRIIALAQQGPAAISGQVRRDGSALFIGSTRVTNFRARAGSFVTAVGTGDGRRLRVSSAASGFSAYFDATQRQRLSATGYLAPDPDGRGYHLSGFGLPMNPASNITPAMDRARIFKGILDRSFLIESAT